MYLLRSKNSTSNFRMFWPHCISGVSWARNASHTWREISKPSYHTRLYSTNLVTFTCFLSLQIWLLCLYRIHKWDHNTVQCSEINTFVCSDRIELLLPIWFLNDIKGMNHSLYLKKKLSSAFQNLHQLLLTIERQSSRVCQRQLIKRSATS